MLETSGERALYRIKEGAEQVLKEGPTGQSKKELLVKTLTSEGKYEKLINFFRLIKSSLPDNFKISNDALKKFFYDTSNLPFDPEKYNFEENNLGNGGQVRVYLLRSKTDEPSLALKVFRPENESSDVIELAVRLKQEREDVGILYSSIEGLIPEEQYVVMEDPFEKGRPAVTIMEEFFSGEMFDIFSFSPIELSEMAKNNPLLKDQLTKFIKITLDDESLNGQVIDILGPKNLIAIKVKTGSFQLVLLDPHGHITTRGNSDDRIPKANKNLDFLKQVLSLIEN